MNIKLIIILSVVSIIATSLMIITFQVTEEPIPLQEPEFAPNQLEKILSYCEKKNNVGPDEVINDIGLQYYNQTHTIDNNTCEWREKEV
jgi:Na+-translocating ferredoxin:NAD+ oxidoreductase RnfG subunit